MYSLLGFDVGEFSENGPDDIEGLDASAIHVTNLLSAEPAGSKFQTEVIFYSTIF